MKRFVFRLEKVMEARRSWEKVRQKELTEARETLDAEHSMLKSLEREQHGRQEEIRERGKTGVSAGEMVVYYTYLMKLFEDIAGQRTKVVGLEEEVEKRRAALLGASKERKILENLREHQIVSYRKRLNRAEQAFMDELSHMPFGFSHRDHKRTQRIGWGRL